MKYILIVQNKNVLISLIPRVRDRNSLRGLLLFCRFVGMKHPTFSSLIHACFSASAEGTDKYPFSIDFLKVKKKREKKISWFAFIFNVCLQYTMNSLVSYIRVYDMEP